MSADLTTALTLMKTRLNRTQEDTALDGYLTARLNAAAGDLEGAGIHLTDEVGDTVFLVDYAVWQYQSRDKAAGMPDWLKLRRRERWLRERGEAT